MQLNNETLDFITDSFEQIRVFASEESSHERGVSFVHSDSQECSIQLCAEACCGEKRFTSLESSVFGFLAEREDDAFDDELCISGRSLIPG